MEVARSGEAVVGENDGHDMSEDEALEALSDFLKPRIEQARRGELSTKSFEDIRKEAQHVYSGSLYLAQDFSEYTLDKAGHFSEVAGE